MSTPRVYTQKLSLKRGETLRVCASYDDGSVAPEGAFLRLFRVAEIDDAINPTSLGGDIVNQSVNLPASRPATWNREEVGYKWQPCFKIGITEDPNAWPVGLYAVQISDSATFAASGTAYFLVRPASPTPATNIMLCWPWSTTAAYVGNYADFTSLYDSDEPKRSRRVALQRPFDVFPAGFGDKRGYTHQLPLKLWNWLVSEGYAVDPCTSFDLDAEDHILDGYQLLISVGHDEYWSHRMREHVESFVANGGNFAVFSANTAWWAVRMEESGEIMACCKSSVEDPVVAIDPELTTSNWASSPVNHPENRLTGVSFRRGSMAFGTPYTIVADPETEPFLKGIDPGSTIPQDPKNESIFGLETDAADFTVEGGQYVATGRDGTPLNFRILAVADFTKRNLGRKGATMGYFTNGGTVFTAGTTDWAAHLDEPSVQAITRNVVSILTKPIPGSPWTLLSRQYPGADWTTLQQPLGHAEAIVALFQGDLLLHQDSGPVMRGDAEDPTGPWSPTGLPPLTGVTSMGTRLYSPYVYATSKTLGLLYHDFDDETGPWATLTPPQPGNCIAACAAARQPMFVIYEDLGEQALYRDNPPWTKIGPVEPPMQAMAAWNTKLFGVAEGRLHCREAIDIDLLWSIMGDAPPGNTFSLTAYFDMLLALAETRPGDPTSRALMWRAATPSVGGIDPWMLFGRNALSGSPALEFALGPLPGTGSFHTLVSGSASGINATHAIQIGRQVAFLYNSATRAGWVIKFFEDGRHQVVHKYPAASFSPWTSIVAVPKTSFVLFYDKNAGHGVVGHFDNSGLFHEDWHSSNIMPGWTQIASTWQGNLIFYRSDTGMTSWGTLQVDGSLHNRDVITGMTPQWDRIIPAGSRGLFFYRSADGLCAFGELDEGFRTLNTETYKKNWHVFPVENGTVLFYDRPTGEGVTAGFRNGHLVPLRAYPAGSFLAGWDLVASIGSLI